MKEGSGHEYSIRFITSDYEELFRIPDGGMILVTFPDRQFAEKCSYIDDYHTTIGNSVYHICQCAEILELNGGRCEPEPETLLDQAAWQECEAWLNGIVFDDPAVLNRVEMMILHPERRSVLEKLHEEEQARQTRPPRPLLPDREERCLE